MHEKTLAELAAGLRVGEYSSVELTRHYLGRIAQYDARLNSFITVTAEQALADAAAADDRLAQGETGLLTGIPIAYKDIFCTEGVKTSCGSYMLDNFIAPYDATVVSNLRDAGVVMLGKTNMDEFAMGSTNESSHYGPVLNPWDTDCVPGGSSGGSATAVAARLSAAAIGTDTGGSVRQPAALTGLTGLKPTYGRCSRWGMVAYASSLDQAGPLAQTAEDIAIVLGGMAGFDAKDSTSVDHPVDDYMSGLEADLKGLKIGLPKEYFGDGLDAEVAEAVLQSVRVYESMGAEIVDVSLRYNQPAVSAYYVVALAEASSNLSRYDGVRFGHRCENPQDLADLYKRSRSEGFGAEVKRRIMLGCYTLSAGYYDAYYLKAQKIRRLIADDFRRVLQEVDLIVGPVTPYSRLPIGQMMDDPIRMYLGDIYTVTANLSGLPAISYPVGRSQAGMPIGAQMIGDYWREGQLLSVAHQYQQQTHWRQMPTMFAAQVMRTRVYVLYAGGTIGMLPRRPDDLGSPLEPGSLAALLDFLPDFMPLPPDGGLIRNQLRLSGGRLIDLTWGSIQPVDSANITPQHWHQIANRLHDIYHAYEGFVVLHGTDTMAYTSSALSFLLKNLAKPVVLTGSQLPISAQRTDAVFNLINAIHVAAYQVTHIPLIPEVVIVFANQILRGNRATKISSSALAGFESPNFPPLGRIDEQIKVDVNQLQPLPQSSDAFCVATDLMEGVFDITVFPGLTESPARHIFLNKTVQGLVMRTYGTGNAPAEAWFLNMLRQSINGDTWSDASGELQPQVLTAGRLIVSVSQCLQGGVRMGLYASGDDLLKRGVLSGLDMTPEAALTKLMWVLGAYQSRTERITQMQINQCGEQAEVNKAH